MGKDVLVLHRWVGQLSKSEHLHRRNGKRPLEGGGEVSKTCTYMYMSIGTVTDAENLHQGIYIAAAAADIYTYRDLHT